MFKIYLSFVINNFYFFVLFPSIAAENLQSKNKYKGPVTIGDGVSIHVPSYHRGFYKNVLRLPGVIVTSELEDDIPFYTIAVVGGLLNDIYIRENFHLEVDLPLELYGFDKIDLENLESLKLLNVKEAVRQFGMYRDQHNILPDLVIIDSDNG